MNDLNSVFFILSTNVKINATNVTLNINEDKNERITHACKDSFFLELKD